MLDQALRARVLVSSEPRDLWIAGQLDTVDPWAQVTALAQARTRVPDEKLFLASLAMACLAPLQPLPPECDATDRLADWATRDADNGVPSLLLADRARRRNNTASMVAFLEEAATRPRFDDYQSRGALIVWETVRALPGTSDPAARAELAAALGVAHTSGAASRLQSLCRDAQRARRQHSSGVCCGGNGGGAACLDMVAAHRGREARRAFAGAGRAASSSPTCSDARSSARKRAIRSRRASSRATLRCAPKPWRSGKRGSPAKRTASAKSLPASRTG